MNENRKSIIHIVISFFVILGFEVARKSRINEKGILLGLNFNIVIYGLIILGAFGMYIFLVYVFNKSLKKENMGIKKEVTMISILLSVFLSYLLNTNTQNLSLAIVSFILFLKILLQHLKY